MGIAEGTSILNPVAEQGEQGGGQGGAGGQGGGAAGGAVGGDGAKWFSALPEDLRSSPDITKYNSVEELARAFIHRGTLLGRDKIVLPPPNAPERDWDDVWSKLGRPAKPEDYRLTDQVKIPEGYELDPSEVTAYAGLAHKIGLTPKQAAALVQFHVDMDSARFARVLDENKKIQQQIETQLRQSWGTQYEGNVAFLTRIIQTMAPKDRVEPLLTKIGSDPDLLLLLHTVSSKLGEDTLGAGGRSQFMMSPSEAKRRIAEIRGDPKHPFNDRNHPDHKHAVQEMQRLYDQASPEGT